MGRSAVLVGGLLLGCSSMLRAPGMLPRQAEKAETEHHEPAPQPALTDVEIHEFVTERLAQLAYGLGPLCGHRCRALPARADADLERPAGLSVGSEFAVHYRPDVFRSVVPYSESFATYMLGHEMGHYVDIAIAGSEHDDQWRLELAADVIAGCAFASLRLRVELVHAIMLASATPENPIDAQLDLVCGSDSEHPALRWELEAFETGTRLCQTSVPPLERLEAEVTDLRHDAQRAAEKARKWFPPLADPCDARRPRAAAGEHGRGVGSPAL